MLVIANDPFKTLFEAVYELYPDLKANIQFNPELSFEDDEFGCTTFPDDGSTPLIDINPQLTVLDALEIIVHEIAHVVCGPDHEHDKEWKRVFSQIHEKFQEVAMRIVKE